MGKRQVTPLSESRRLLQADREDLWIAHPGADRLNHQGGTVDLVIGLSLNWAEGLRTKTGWYRVMSILRPGTRRRSGVF